MKQILIFSIVMIGLFSCKKSIENNTPISPINSELTTGDDENQKILNNLYNTDAESLPDWIVKIIKWVKAHTGAPQPTSISAPQCSGDIVGTCGPCKAFCSGSSTLSPIGNNGIVVNNEDYQAGLRALGISVIEHNETQELKLVFTFNQDLIDFVEEGVITVYEDAYLAQEFIDLIDYNSIQILQGAYTVFEGEDGLYRAIIDAHIN